jgi:hypothetical protein
MQITYSTAYPYRTVPRWREFVDAAGTDAVWNKAYRLRRKQKGKRFIINSADSVHAGWLSKEICVTDGMAA